MPRKGVPEPPPPDALRRRPRDLVRILRQRGWSLEEATAFAAFAQGLPIFSGQVEFSWSLRQIEHLIALREFRRLGRLPS